MFMLSQLFSYIGLIQVQGGGLVVDLLVGSVDIVVFVVFGVNYVGGNVINVGMLDLGNVGGIIVGGNYVQQVGG